MKRIVYHFCCSLIAYSVCAMVAPAIFVMPSQTIRFAIFLPSLLGLMWGPVAAAGVFVGELLTGMDWQAVSQLVAGEGTGAALEQSFRLLYCDAACVFFAAYLPPRLWHSYFVRPKEPLFSSRAACLLKFVGILFLTFAVTSVFQCLAMNAEGWEQLREGTDFRINSCLAYALLCFVNDFNIAVFFGSICFFYLISHHYAFYRPRQKSVPTASVRRICDGILVCALLLGLILLFQPIQEMERLEPLRMMVNGMFLLYLFRPLSSEISRRTESKAQDVSGGATRFPCDKSWKTGFLFFLSFFALFVFLDISGIIYDLNRIDTWRQYSAECLTMVNVTMVALFYLLLRYRHSIMMDIVLLDVVTVFVSAAVLGWGCFFAMDYALNQHVEQSMEEMSAICRERMRRTFDGIRVSVNGMKALALYEMESYDRLANDEAYRQDYLKRMERVCELVGRYGRKHCFLSALRSVLCRANRRVFVGT